MPITQRHAAKTFGRMLLPASCDAPIRQNCIETSAKSEVATVYSWQFAGDETAEHGDDLDHARAPSLRGGIGAAGITYRGLVPLLADGINGREDSVIYCGGFTN